MVAFATSVTPRGAQLYAHRRSTCRRQPPFRMCSASNGTPPPTDGVPARDEYVARALDSGAEMRAKLEQVTEERRQMQERSLKRIDDINLALEAIMQKIQAHTGDQTPAPTREDTPPAAPRQAEPRAVASSASDDDDSEPYTDPNMLGLDSTAGWQVLTDSDALPLPDSAPVEFRIECDGSACSLISIGDTAPGPGVRQQWSHSGRGFRVGYDPDAPRSFCGMVGTDTWLLGLDVAEIGHFKRLCLSLCSKMARIDRGDERMPEPRQPALRRSGDGMFNERVVSVEGSQCSVEVESQLMWVQAVGKPRLGSYAIRVIFMERRQSEGYWAAEVVPGLLSAVAKLEVD